MDKTNYELTCLISPDLNQNEIEDLLKKIEGFCPEAEEIKRKEDVRRIRLSYPINKKREAFICLYEIETLPEKIKEFQKKIKGEKDIIRFLLIKKSKKEIKEKTRGRKEKPLPRTSAESKKKGQKKEENKKVELKKVEEKLGEILE